MISPVGLCRKRRAEYNHGIHPYHCEPAPDGRRTVHSGLRIPVPTVVDMIANGMTEGDILKAYPDLEAADVGEALHYGVDSVP